MSNFKKEWDKDQRKEPPSNQPNFPARMNAAIERGHHIFEQLEPEIIDKGLKGLAVLAERSSQVAANIEAFLYADLPTFKLQYNAAFVPFGDRDVNSLRQFISSVKELRAKPDISLIDVLKIKRTLEASRVLALVGPALNPDLAGTDELVLSNDPSIDAIAKLIVTAQGPAEIEHLLADGGTLRALIEGISNKKGQVETPKPKRFDWRRIVYSIPALGGLAALLAACGPMQESAMPTPVVQTVVDIIDENNNLEVEIKDQVQPSPEPKPEQNYTYQSFGLGGAEYTPVATETPEDLTAKIESEKMQAAFVEEIERLAGNPGFVDGTLLVGIYDFDFMTASRSGLLVVIANGGTIDGSLSAGDALAIEKPPEGSGNEYRVYTTKNYLDEQGLRQRGLIGNEDKDQFNRTQALEAAKLYLNTFGLSVERSTETAQTEVILTKEDGTQKAIGTISFPEDNQPAIAIETDQGIQTFPVYSLRVITTEAGEPHLAFIDERGEVIYDLLEKDEGQQIIDKLLNSELSNYLIKNYIGPEILRVLGVSGSAEELLFENNKQLEKDSIGGSLQTLITSQPIVTHLEELEQIMQDQEGPHYTNKNGVAIITRTELGEYILSDEGQVEILVALRMAIEEQFLSFSFDQAERERVLNYPQMQWQIPINLTDADPIIRIHRPTVTRPTFSNEDYESYTKIINSDDVRGQLQSAILDYFGLSPEERLSFLKRTLIPIKVGDRWQLESTTAVIDRNTELSQKIEVAEDPEERFVPEIIEFYWIRAEQETTPPIIKQLTGSSITPINFAKNQALSSGDHLSHYWHIDPEKKTLYFYALARGETEPSDIDIEIFTRILRGHVWREISLPVINGLIIEARNKNPGLAHRRDNDAHNQLLQRITDEWKRAHRLHPDLPKID